MFTRRTWFRLVVAILFACLSPTYAEGPPPAYQPEQLSVIREAQIRVSENRDALSAKDLAPNVADARVARILVRLNADLPANFTEATLMGIDVPNLVSRLTIAERKQGFFAGVNFLRLGLIAVFTILTLLLIGRRILQTLIHFPKELWEILACACGLGLLIAQGLGKMPVNQFWAFFGCLLIGGGLGLALVIHSDYFEGHLGFKKHYLQYVYPTIMLAAFCVASLINKSEWMGAFAALSLMSLLGFAGEVIPFGYAIGFKDRDALARATPAGLIIAVLFLALHAGNVTHPYLRVFEPGALIVGGFVGYMGLLIASSNRYRKRQRWILMQAIMVAFCFAGVIGASLIGVKSIQIMAGVFLTLWTIEKMVEIPGDGFVPWVLKLMAVSGTLYLVVTYGAPFFAKHLIS